MIRSTVCSLVALFAFTLTSTAAEPMVWKFEVGQEFRYQLVQNMLMNMNAGAAGNMETKTNQTIDMVWIVQSVNEDGSARMKHDIERVQMTMAPPLGEGYELDTASPDPPNDLAMTISPIFQAMVESDYHVTMTPQGEVKDFEAPEALAEAIKNIPGGGGMVDTNETLKLMAMQIAVPLPQGAVEEGASWSTTYETSAAMFGKQTVDTTYTYKGSREVGDKTFEVFSPEIKLTAGAAGQGGAGQGAAGPAGMSGTLKSKNTEGEVFFDRGAGRLDRSHMTQETDMEMKAGGTTLTATIEQTTTVQFGKQSPPYKNKEGESEAEQATEALEEVEDVVEE